MQMEISFAAAYDFNQYTQYVPCPTGAPAPPSPVDFDPFPAPPRPTLWGDGGVPGHPCPIDFWLSPPRPAPSRERNNFPVHPWYTASHLITKVRIIRHWQEHIIMERSKTNQMREWSEIPSVFWQIAFSILYLNSPKQGLLCFVRIVHCFCLLARELMLDKTRGTSREGAAVSLMTTSVPLICLKPTIIENLSRGIKTFMFIKGFMCTFRLELS